MSSSGQVRSAINGRHATLSPTAQWYQTDAKGVLNIVLETKDATCHQFAADAFRSANGGIERALGSPLLDPTHKVAKKLEGIKSADDLRALRKPNGEPLIQDNILEEDLKTGAKSIDILIDQIHKFHEQDGAKIAAYNMTLSTRSANASLSIGQFDFFGDLVDDVEAIWHWLDEKIKDIVKWGVELVGKILADQV